MDNEIFLTILEKYLRGDCTPEEETQLLSWYESIGQEHRLPYPDSDKLDELREKGWEGITGKYFPGFGKKTKPIANLRVIKRWLVAASSLTIIILGSVFYAVDHNGGHRIVSTTPGERKKIILPDNSSVWLNSASRIEYAADMHKERLVVLDEGEAYFDIHRDERHPFVVHAPGGIAIRVLGTSFTVKSYQAMSESRVTVLTGKVLVQKNGRDVGILAKGQGAILSARHATEQLIHVDSAEVAGWTYGRIKLNDVPFEELVVALENTYGYRIVTDPSLREVRSSISFSAADRLVDILDVLRTIYRVTYRVDSTGKVIYLKRK